MRFPDPAYLECCTAQRKNGAFCDRPTMPNMPFPICQKHAQEVYEWYADHLQVEAKSRYDLLRDMMAPHEPSPESVARDEMRREALAAQSVVYYVRIGDRVKIGYTTNARARMSALRVDDDAVLATEPGGRELEAQRHREFAAERVGRREDFNPSRRLLAHIDAIRAEHGEPQITSYPRVG